MPRWLTLVLVLPLVAFLARPAAAQRVSCEGGVADPPGSSAIYPCNGVDLLSQVTLAEMDATYANDIWGWTDPTNGREYALVGLGDGTAFVDITNPLAPVFLGTLPTQTQASTWRDIKTDGDYAFIVSEAGGHGMQVFDLTRLRNVPLPPATFTADVVYTGIGSAHNIVLNEETGFAYAVGANDCAGGLHM
ncbi:MAG: choice-of-anchor B family protein, partial [Rhodothermales bacterium]|nr:choice-of-anchor B family protein [Rhodothermales bacterium]